MVFGVSPGGNLISFQTYGTLGLGVRPRKYVPKVIKRISARLKLKRKRGHVYFEWVIRSISLPYNSPKEYYIVDAGTFETVMKVIDYLWTYKEALEEMLENALKKIRELKWENGELMRKHTLLRNWVVKFESRACAEAGYRTLAECIEEWYKLISAVETELYVKSLHSDCCDECDEALNEELGSPHRLKSKIEKMYLLSEEP